MTTTEGADGDGEDGKGCTPLALRLAARVSDCGAQSNRDPLSGQGKSMGRVVLVVLVCLFAGSDELAGQLRWLKGNVHVHTDQSDGTSPPAEVVEWYRTHDYAFLFVTDH